MVIRKGTNTVLQTLNLQLILARFYNTSLHAIMAQKGKKIDPRPNSERNDAIMIQSTKNAVFSKTRLRTSFFVNKHKEAAGLLQYSFTKSRLLRKTAFLYSAL